MLLSEGKVPLFMFPRVWCERTSVLSHDTPAGLVGVAAFLLAFSPGSSFVGLFLLVAWRKRGEQAGSERWV